MRVALAQINSVVGDFPTNRALIISQAQKASEAGAQVVVFPELAVCGYPPEDLLFKEHFVLKCRETLEQVAQACPGLVMVLGAPLVSEGRLFNAAVVLAEGRIATWYGKILLPNYGVFDEKRYFAPGSELMILDTGRDRVALSVCEDIWDGHGPAVTAALAGKATVLINISMSPYHVGKGIEREQMLAERAVTCGAHLVYVNGVGGQDELVFDGHSVVMDPAGNLIARAAQFSPDLLLVEVNGGHAERPLSSCDGSTWPLRVFPLRLPENTATGCTSLARSLVTGERLAPLLEREAEVYEALRVGVRDYALKNGFERVVMGISGGIDSALTACIAADALGPEKVTAVSMPSRYTSAGTRADAREVAARLGINFYEISIERIYRAYLESLSAFVDEHNPGITEQNIQARIRGNLVMALSNKFGWLVLTTGNKSEMAVGYATLYGDMAGGFAVLKDVPKTLVYQLAKYRNSLGPGDGPIPQSVIDRVPSAELAPGQTDQDTLPPYEILDQIIEAYVVEDQSIEEIADSGLDGDLVQRVVAMIDGNEYKRRQAPPGVRITPKAFGKDRRLPITNKFRG
ncbi:MAG: NAD+ synthase [Thermoleophilia bacterium]|nr:NAD+ synthase [Thermoleophilia bacterium]